MDVMYAYEAIFKVIDSLGSILLSGEWRKNRAYTATDAAFVEWVEGKPYSRLALLERVMRLRGGESGRGMHNKSFRKPLKKTPDARICTML